MRVFILLIFLLSKTSQAQASLAQNFYPDVIRCQDKFYYIGFSSPTLSTYYAATGSKDQIESYQIINGVLRNAINPLGSKTCENQTVQSLWNSKRAYRIQNWGQISNLSIVNALGVPDAIKCQNKILYILNAFFEDFFFLNFINQIYRSSSLNSPPHTRNNFNCLKSLDQLKADGEAYHFVTKVVQAGGGQMISSMTSKYPDAISCYQGVVLFIHSTNDGESSVTYRGHNGISLVQIKFNDNGSVIQSFNEESVFNCKQKSLYNLISEGRTFLLNNNPLQCPKDLITIDSVINFLVKAHPELTVESTPASGSIFKLGTTEVKVEGEHSNGLKIQCVFKVTRKLAPKITCPQNIRQNDSFVAFEATATDNSEFPLKISYTKQPGSKFSIGDTRVMAKATDFLGNQSVCTFKVTILVSELPVIEIILGVLAGLGVISAIVIVLLCKKFKKGCFKVQDQDPIVRPLD